jgi:putative peptidoglycan lipid II flippase
VALWLWPEPGLAALVWSLVIGSAAQLLLVCPAFVRLGWQRHLRRHGAHLEVKDTLKLGAPILPAVLLSNATLALVQLHTAQLGEGAVSVMGYAMRLHGALSQVLVIGLGTVLLPHFAELWAHGRKDDIQVLFRRLARGGILIIAILVGGIYLFGESAVAILFVRGAFDAAAANQVADIWLLYSLALFPLAFGTFVAKLVSAMRQPVVLLASGFILFAVTWTVASAGASTGDIANIALAGVAGFSATMVFWLAWLSRHLEVKPLLWDMLNGVLRVAVVVGPVILADHYIFAPRLEDWSVWSQLLGRISVFAAIATALLWSLGLHRWFFASTYDGATKQGPSR